MPSILGANTLSSGGYDVANSVRFNVADNAKLSRSISGSPTDPDKFTISFWMKKCALSNQVVFGNYANGNFRSELSFSSDDRLQYFQVNDGSASFDVVLSRQFRDPSAWYHIVFVYDSGQGTDTNRFKFFVNGVHDTSYSHTSPYPAQDLDGRLNQASQTLVIGQDGNDAKDFNGYLAEVVLIDGQALDADQFGEFDSDSGIWKPIDVSELTFGDDGFYLDFETDGTNTGFVDFSSNNYAITRVGSTIHSFAQAKFDSSSIYFDGSGDALTLADGNQWDFGTGDYTLEFWVNKAHTGKESVFETRGSGGNGFNIEFNSSNVLEWYDGSITGTLPVDGSAVTANTWVHFAFVRASNVHKMYRNGTEVGTALTSSSSQQSTGGPNIGRRLESSSANDYTGYLDEIRLSTVARYTSNFTAPSASFVSDSDTRLLIQSKASNLLGGDKSGVGNHLTTTNLAATDQSIDTCTNNFCTWNPIANYTNGVAFTEGNLVAMSGTNDQWDSGRATMGFSKGKWYFECLFVAGVSTQYIGVTDESCKMNTANAHDEDGVTVFYNNSGGEIRKDGTATTADYGTFTSSQVAGIAIDADNFTISVYKGGSLIVDAYALSTTRTGFLFPFTTNLNNGDGVKVNFGSPPYSESGGNTDANGYGNFNQSVPSGYFAINTKNLAEHG